MVHADQVATVLKYCLKDCTLVIDLILKLCIFTNSTSMANVTHVPVTYLELKGQQIKVHSQLLYESRLNDCLVPTLPYKNENEIVNEEKFTGATVQDAEPGAHFEPIAGFDFASLYPSIMIANNYCYSTIVKNPKYDNLESVEYKDIIWTEDTGTEKERTETVRFVQSSKGILPIMLDKLWTERKAIKKEMKEIKKKIANETDSDKINELKMYYDVLDGFQLAIKVSMNSIYGFTGCKIRKVTRKKNCGCSNCRRS